MAVYPEASNGGELSLFLQGGFAKSKAKENVSRTRCFLAFPEHFTPVLEAFHRFCALATTVKKDESQLAPVFLGVFSDGVAASVSGAGGFQGVLSEIAADTAAPLTQSSIARQRLRYTASALFSPKQEAWSEVAPLYTLRFVDDFLKPQVLLGRLLEEQPGTIRLEKEAVRAQRAHELVSWKNNPFPTVPDPQLFWRRKFRTSDESARGGPKVRIRRMPPFPQSPQRFLAGPSRQRENGSEKELTRAMEGRSRKGTPALPVYLYKYRSRCVPCRRESEEEERPFFGVDAATVEGPAKIVVNGRFAVDYTALPKATQEQLLRWRRDSFVVLPFLPGTRCAMSSADLDGLREEDEEEEKELEPGHWREVQGVRQCYQKAGKGAKLMYNAKALKFAFLAGPEDAKDKEEAFWRRRYAENPFGTGFLCL